jgi:hypothetical protein
MKSQSQARVMAVALALAGLCLLNACASMSATARMFGHEPLLSPDEQHIRNLVCLGQTEAARMYIDSAQFTWIGPNRDRFFTDALMFQFRGGCSCAGKTCAEKAFDAAKQN